MNGANAVFPVTTISRPNKSRIKTIGANQSFLRTRRNNQNSFIIPILLIVNL